MQALRSIGSFLESMFDARSMPHMFNSALATQSALRPSRPLSAQNGASSLRRICRLSPDCLKKISANSRTVIIVLVAAALIAVQILRRKKPGGEPDPITGRPKGEVRHRHDPPLLGQTQLHGKPGNQQQTYLPTPNAPLLDGQPLPSNNGNNPGEARPGNLNSGAASQGMTRTPIKPGSQMNTSPPTHALDGYPPGYQIRDRHPLVDQRRAVPSFSVGGAGFRPTSGLAPPLSDEPAAVAGCSNEDRVILASYSEVTIPRVSVSGAQVGMGSHTFMPWAHSTLEVSSGKTIFRKKLVFPQDETESYLFVNDKELVDFQRKNGVTFHLLMTKHFSLADLSREDKLNRGIPPDALFSQFIYPAALNVTFRDERNSANINDARQILRDQILRTKDLREELKDLLMIGGNIYYKTDWFPDPENPGKSKRDICKDGVRVLRSRPALPGEPSLHLGQTKIVPPGIVRELKARASNTDEYFKDGGGYPAMNPVTVPVLRDKGMTHFGWLNPDDPLIVEMQKKMGDRTFASDGAFIYFSETNPNLSCMAPYLKNPDTWKKQIRRLITYNIDQPNGERVSGIREAECIVCAESMLKAANKVVHMLPCNHMNTCEPCVRKLDKIGRGNISCPSCRGRVTKWSTPELHYKHFGDLANFTLTLAKVNWNYVQKVNLNDFLLREEFQSPPSETPKKLLAKLELPDDGSHASYTFMYPIFGKGQDSVYDMIGQVLAATTREGHFEGMGQLSALVSCGGFVFYDRTRRMSSVYAFLPPNNPPVRPEFTIQMTTGDLQGNDTITPEIAKLDRPIEAERQNLPLETAYNVSRVTLDSLFPYAKYVQFPIKNNNVRFVYSNGDRKGRGNWQATME